MNKSYPTLDSRTQLIVVDLRIRKIKCGKKCKYGKGKYHAFYLYKTWREGKKIKEKYLGVCDEGGNLKEN